jgi:hypothetical protein
VKELIDEDRRRLDEYKRALQKIKQATTLADLVEQYTPIEYSLEPIYERVQWKVNKISDHYSNEIRTSTDLIVYFNLHDVLVPEPVNVVKLTFNDREWRSVSVVGSSWSYIIAARQNAPNFIRYNMHSFKRNYVARD